MVKKYNSVTLETMLFDDVERERSDTLDGFQCWLEHRLHRLDAVAKTEEFLRVSAALSEFQDYRLRHLRAEAGNG
jgi:hypothetical protein